MPSFKDSLVVVVARCWIRYAPTKVFKERLWRFAHWRDHRYTARVSTGFLMRGRSNDVVQGYAYYFGTWEPNLSAWLRERLAGIEDAVFVDVGANVGYYSLMAHTLFAKTSSVVAVEASPMIHDLLVENVRLNRFDRIRTVNCAAGAGQEMLTLYHGSANNLGGTTSGAWGRNDDSFEIESRTLATILTDDEIARVRLIKIDVEGAEQNVIEGLRPLLPRLPVDVEIVVEVVPTSAKSIFAIFAEAGFHRYHLANHYSYKGYLTHAPIEAPIRSRLAERQRGFHFFAA